MVSHLVSHGLFSYITGYLTDGVVFVLRSQSHYLLVVIPIREEDPFSSFRRERRSLAAYRLPRMDNIVSCTLHLYLPCCAIPRLFQESNSKLRTPKRYGNTNAEPCETNDYTPHASKFMSFLSIKYSSSLILTIHLLTSPVDRMLMATRATSAVP